MARTSSVAAVGFDPAAASTTAWAARAPSAPMDASAAAATRPSFLSESSAATPSAHCGWPWATTRASASSN